jgi:PilZ domain
MGQEQRRAPRIVTRQKIWCEGQESPVVGETRDVSASGMFIVAERAPEVGTQFNVTFNDEEGEVSLKMEVMWRGAKTEDNKTGMGVRIVGFDKGAEVYERFLSRHERTNEGRSGQAPKPGVSAEELAAALADRASGERR